MWSSLPRDLQTLVLDFFGDTSIDAHRRFGFVRAELKTVFMFSCVPDRPRPSFAQGIGRIEMLKKFLQLTHLKSQCKALFETHGSSGIPYSFELRDRNFRSISNHGGLDRLFSRLSSRIW